MTQAELRLVIERERARADRTRSPLCVVLLELGEGQLRSDAPLHFPVVIARRLRCTDAIGWFNEDSLAILLADTDHAGAVALTNQLREALRGATRGVRWRILVYPENQPCATQRLQVGASAHRRTQETVASGASSNGDEPGHWNLAHSATANPGEIRAASTAAAAASRDTLRAGSVPQPEPLRAMFEVPTSPAKRTLDILGAGLGLLLLSPLMASAAVAVRVSSPGPIFFTQQRAGPEGRNFTFYKFRTMQIDAEQRKQELLQLNEQSGPVFKIERDPRITRVGRFLRKASIDELPQLWNVLIGDMSLVGPRPPITDEVRDYEPWQQRRLEIRGGLTCIWQVSGRSAVRFDDWVRMDLRYAKTNSFRKDLVILLKTIPAVLTGRGAH
jgi:lipopolysaccharide/colanic/teichoic acid biosynthesis glycosyltransferase